MGLHSCIFSPTSSVQLLSGILWAFSNWQAIITCTLEDNQWFNRKVLSPFIIHCHDEHKLIALTDKRQITFQSLSSLSLQARAL